MNTHALHHYPQRAGLSRWLIVGFLAGAAAVLLFHQSALALLHALQLSRSAPFSFTPTQPFGLPPLWSLARLDGARLIVAAVVFGAIAPTLVAMAVGPIVNGAWGLGTGIGLYLFGRRH